MEEINKRLTEVDYILKKLDNKYINKIPQDVWDYITENKDKNYVFKYDDDKTLAEQNLSIDTISILTYINMEYLLEEEAKRELLDLLKNDEITAEQKKRKKYNPDDLKGNANSFDNSLNEWKKLYDMFELTVQYYSNLEEFENLYKEK